MRFFNLWHLKEELLALLLALRDIRTPASGKIFAIISLVYLLSPADIIADIIPLLGIFDDIIITSVGAWLSRKHIPDHVMHDARKQAKGYTGLLNKIAIILFFAILLWLLLAIGLVLLLMKTFWG